MVFSSPLFLFGFLPVTLLAYFATGRRNTVLLAASLVFYAWGEPRLVVVLLLSIGLNYLFALAVERVRGRPWAGALVAAAVGVNLGLLAVCKYATFIVENVNAALGVLSMAPVDVPVIALPLGISFYTFHALSYVVDVHRGRVAAAQNPLSVALYVTLFPQLVAGPIVRYVDIAAQIAHRVVSRAGFASGVRRFIVGLAKKVLVANTLAVPADALFALPAEELTAGLAWLAVVCYTLQIYFDFSGYSDMAIGLGRMFGFEFRENFAYPYAARSVTEFWRRWHISLSTWFRDYLYIPLGGNRRGPARTFVNLLVVFTLCGLWHGASWTFVVWGLYHGSLLVAERIWTEERPAGRDAPLRWACTLVAVMVGWVFFRADDLIHAISILAAMAGFAEGTGLAHHVGLYLLPDVGLALVVGAVASMPVAPALARVWEGAARSQAGVAAIACAEGVALALLFAGSAMSLAVGTYNPFIYFRF